MAILHVCIEGHKLSKKKWRLEWRRTLVKWVVWLRKSGVGLKGKKNGNPVSLRAFVVRVDRGVNYGWIVKREGNLV